MKPVSVLPTQMLVDGEVAGILGALGIDAPGGVLGDGVTDVHVAGC